MAEQFLPPTALRVRQSTQRKINIQLDNKTQMTLQKYEHASQEEITVQLKQLDKEWDTERFLEANAAAFVLIGVALSIWVNPWWLLLSGLVAFYLFQHAIQGWCPPLPLIRKAGIRTPREIDEERAGLISLLQNKSKS